MAETIILTYRYRIKDRSASTRRALRAQARAVNSIWNYCCNIDRQARARYAAGQSLKRPSAFDLTKLCRGVTTELGIHSDTIDAVCGKFVKARDAYFPNTPRFRSYKRNLDWIPFSTFARPARLEGSILTLRKRRYHLWLSRKIPAGAKAKTIIISTDARGRWYANIQIEFITTQRQPTKAVGVDLGLKSLATLSDGTIIGIPSCYRKAEFELALYHKRGQKVRARALQITIANRRRHYLHVASARIARQYSEIYVGDVSPSRLAKTKMAKSIYDAGWAKFRSFLSYKAIAQGGRMYVVSERWTTQTCSSCGSVSSADRPKGIACLGIRDWTCSDCGTSHDRDINAAMNILRLGLEHRPPAEEIRKLVDDANGQGPRQLPTD